MPTPMKFDDVKRLIGGSGSIGDRLRLKYAQVQTAQTGTLVDRERQFLVGQGSKVGDSRTDLWRKYVGVSAPARPWGKFKSLTALAHNTYAYKYFGKPAGDGETQYIARKWFKRAGTAEGVAGEESRTGWPRKYAGTVGADVDAASSVSKVLL